ncbi:hypothetical protein CYLTODRAFT_403940 [Cylindrobasidium torrendii FP15055 ss-10]|uniref:DUF6699 domain-containing protein n=1 Tax=Cylindrobasidium torrendii FP15055 ss-10 TaxID=1314674 RepID=A0A0D7AY64_9AGAR|nr:hypothetical protein CYLTODRAFT_403940 [Cylindrobasidium torrendii FP15055 ss-10]
MSGPFVYDAGAFAQVPSSPAHFCPYNPYANLPQTSPFIPAQAFLQGTPSPFTANVPLPGSPMLGASAPLFGGGSPNVGFELNSPFGPRSRRPSFSGEPIGGIGGQPDTQLPQYPIGYPQPQAIQLHPWLDANVNHTPFWFDVSASVFTPMRIVDNMGTRRPVGLNDLHAPATSPSVHGMRIVCDATPQWALNVAAAPGKALCIGDVLNWIYESMQMKIVQTDWDALDHKEQKMIGRAYARRCRSMGPQYEAAERAQGVKHVDYLLGKVLFVGLTPDYASGALKMHFR